MVLAAAAVLTGIAMLLAFRRFSNQDAIRRAKGRIRAHLYELRLFGDDPRATLRAQKNLFAWNARYAALMLRPAAVVLVPMLVLFVALDCVYGRRPLRPGEAVVVTAPMPDGALAVPAGFAVETPPVRIQERNEVCWRVRARQAAAGELRVTGGGVSAVRGIDARPGLRFIEPAWLAQSIEIDYPRASVSIFGREFWWPVPFVVISLAAMLVLRNRFGVTF